MRKPRADLPVRAALRAPVGQDVRISEVGIPVEKRLRKPCLVTLEHRRARHTVPRPWPQLLGKLPLELFPRKLLDDVIPDKPIEQRLKRTPTWVCTQARSSWNRGLFQKCACSFASVSSTAFATDTSSPSIIELICGERGVRSSIRSANRLVSGSNRPPSASGVSIPSSASAARRTEPRSRTRHPGSDCWSRCPQERKSGQQGVRKALGAGTPITSLRAVTCADVDTEAVLSAPRSS